MPLSQKQLTCLALAWQCFDSEPKIDYTTFATLSGSKNAASAREMLRVAKKALQEEYGAAGGSDETAKGMPASTPASKKRPRSSKKITAKSDDKDDDDEEDDEGEQSSTPSKKKVKPVSKHGTPAKVKAEPKEGEDELGDWSDLL